MDSLVVVEVSLGHSNQKLNHVAWGVGPLGVSMSHAIEISDFMKVRDFIGLAAVSM